MQVSPLVGGADDEHAHVLKAGGGNGRLIVLTNEIPVQIHVIEDTRFDRIDDQCGVSVGGKAHVGDPALCLPATHHIQATSRSDRLIEMGMQIDAVNRQQIDAIHIQTSEGEFEFGLKKRGIRLRWNLGLQDSVRIRTIRQSPAQLSL